MAELSDGRLMSYGTMGGEGQPQTQAAIFSRYALHGQDLQSTVTAPRWLLGRTWGEENNNIKIEIPIRSRNDRGHAPVSGTMYRLLGRSRNSWDTRAQSSGIRTDCSKAQAILAAMAWSLRDSWDFAA